jgi:hypothetical protein
MSSTLSAHSPKFESKLVTLEQLRALPEPQALGRMHKPVAHVALVDGIRREIHNRGYMVKRQELALAANQHALFGVMDLVPADDLANIVGNQERGLSFGFRNAVDQSMAIKAVAGARVFVCDNLALSGDMFALERKNTTGLDLGDALAGGFDRFLEHAQILEVQVMRLVSSPLSDGKAKETIFDIFAARIVPVRLFDDVERFYFRPTDETPDCQPRSLWGLHNAFTRAMKDLSPVRGFRANVALGNAFGIKADGGEIIDTTAVVVN